MKRLLLLSVLTLFLHATSWAYDFSAVNDDGVTIYYNVISSTGRTCEVASAQYFEHKYKDSVEIPASVSDGKMIYSVQGIGDNAFYTCTYLTAVTMPSSVRSIGDNAFYGCTRLTDVEISESVTSVGSGVFQECTSLEKITIGNSMTNIGPYMFYGCSSLAEVTIPNSVTSIEEYAFADCKSLEGITIPNSVTSIGDRAFYRCSSLAKITLPNSVTSIGDYVFSYCSNLEGITIPTSVISIGENAFWYCKSIKKITIPSSVTSIANGTFCSCTGLTEVTIPNSVTSIGGSAFRDCTSLAEVTIPTSVTSIGGSAFGGCTSLDGITIPTSVTSIGGATFASCTSLKEMEIPTSVTSIERSMFSCCTNLVKVTIPNSVTNIGETVFESCKSLTRLTIPSSVTTIGICVFTDCTSLISVTSLNPDPPVCGSGNIISSGLDSCVLYVPKGSKEAYSQANIWKEFNTIVEFAAPTVQTYEATNVASISATLNGYVEAGTEDILEQGFEYWTADDDKNTIEVEGENISVKLTELTPNTTYTFRAYATTEIMTEYGEEMTFTTTVLVAPTVQTAEASNVSNYSATLNGSVVAGSEEILEQGFEYWKSSRNKYTIEAQGENISVTLTELELGTTYTYRAYATTESGTTYGKRMTFTTDSYIHPTDSCIHPTVLTYEATDITGNSATLKGAIRAGDEEILEHGFEYWAAGEDVQSITSTKYYMSETITGLKLSTTYTYRAYASTESETTYGDERTFTTLDYLDGISDVNADLAEVARYTMDGKRISAPQHGMNVVVYSDGTTRKELIK